jgi:hypothetical protein
MTEPFVDSETDRTKSRWVAETFQDFGRPRTTVRGLFYFAMRRGVSDYPICGKLVGEIRICRPYDESDGERLPKWVSRARKLGFIPEDAVLDEIPGERLFSPKTHSNGLKPRIEVWINKSTLSELLLPTCNRYEAALVSVNGKPSENAVESLLQRSGRPTIILCLSDLSLNGFLFGESLARMIAQARPSIEKDIRLGCIGLLPQQVEDFKIPMVHGPKGTKVDRRKYETYLKPYNLDKGKMAELDAMEAYYPGGIAGFLDSCLSKYAFNSEVEKEFWLLDLKKGVFPKD